MQKDLESFAKKPSTLKRKAGIRSEQLAKVIKVSSSSASSAGSKRARKASITSKIVPKQIKK